ncbi:DNase I-like protein [Exidia glandulosa HHB12029]|uniref:DNase I-like protein n=1 Tax=Exidia glandulosa HHB12029 TaxID=1314781 RepID=A0A165GG98_EXIGL|nr:DNase I-like protein [Exidia glandulosa HHB12029]
MSATRVREDGAEGLGGGQPPSPDSQYNGEATAREGENVCADSRSPARASPRLGSHSRDHTSQHGAHHPGVTDTPTPATSPNAHTAPVNPDQQHPLQPQTSWPGTPADSHSQRSSPITLGLPHRPYPGLPRTSPANTRRTPLSTKRTLARLLVASENMRGRGNTTIVGSAKWKKLKASILTDKIGVMAIQETHLTPSHMREIEQFHKELYVINSAHPDNPSGAGGVALAFNKFLTNTNGIQSHELIPGRALLATFNWHKDDELTVLAIYAPNDARESREMWATIANKIRHSGGRIPKPDVILGDMNFVEDNVDRFPMALHSIDAPDSFDDLKRLCNVTDGWRATYPSSVEYSWRDASRSSMSRIDRIYVTEPLLDSSRNWKIETSSLNRDDHSRVSVELVNLDMPEIGPGRWSMKESLLHCPDFLAAVETAGQHALTRLKAYSEDERTPENNPQIIYDEFKRSVITAAKRHQREINCRRRKFIDELEKERDTAKTEMRLNLSDDTRKAFKAAEKKLEDARSGLMDATLAHRNARNWAEGETYQDQTVESTVTTRLEWRN